MQPANEWGWQELLLNNILYQLQLLPWQMFGEKGSEPPKQWLPSFIPKPPKPKSKDMQDSVAMDVDDLKAYLTKPRQNTTVESNE